MLEDGKLHIYRDVYAQNTNTEENLARVLEAHGAKLEDLSEQQRAEVMNALKDVKKETVIDLSSLTQKGYPGPVNLDNGSGKKPATDKTDRTNQKKNKIKLVRSVFNVAAAASQESSSGASTIGAPASP